MSKRSSHCQCNRHAKLLGILKICISVLAAHKPAAEAGCKATAFMPPRMPEFWDHFRQAVLHSRISPCHNELLPDILYFYISGRKPVPT
ncbi:hypothetical protein F5Y17DRAFT_422362 [Xylariaceae sp. FL0594]|nr:hypothetical protein F5Y17DRAFT_422362 [Xylariaceae sp. FL0594]